MTEETKGEPQIVSYNIPRIEVYQVTEDELKRIEEGSSQVSQDFTFMLTSFSICVSFVIALLTGHFESRAELTLKSCIGVFGLSSLYTGWRWFRNRKVAPNVIGNIRIRKVEPKV